MTPHDITTTHTTVNKSKIDDDMSDNNKATSTIQHTIAQTTARNTLL